MGWGQILGGIWLALKWAWPFIRTAAVFLGLAAAHLVVVKTLWAEAFTRIDSLVTGYTAQTINFQPLALVNTFFPLSEGLSMLTAYAAIVGISASVRITKAFIDAKKS